MSTVVTLRPVAGAVSPADGLVERRGVSETFSTIRAGAGNASNTESFGIGIVQLQSTSTSNRFEGLTRALLCFDTSSIPDNAIIISAVIRLYGFSKTNSLGSTDLHICGATPSSTADFANSDYGTLGSVSFGLQTYASFTTSGYNGITLNAAGIAHINKTGVTAFGARLAWDMFNSFGGVWGNTLATNMGWYSADEAGTSKDPELVITYKLYDPDENIAQSVQLSSSNAAMIATALVEAVETKPGSTDIDYAVQSDSVTGFVGVTKDIESALALPALSGNAAHKWRAILDGSEGETPILDSLSISFRRAMPVSATTDRLAQSFSSGAGGNISAVVLNLVKDLADTIDYTVEIHPDVSGSPSGTPITNGTATILAADVPNQAAGGVFSWIAAVFATPPTLTASTTYWIVVKIGTAGSSKLLWRARAASYAGGFGSFSTNSGSSYTTMADDDFLFQILASGGTFEADVIAKYKPRYL